MERFTISKSEKQSIYEIYRACRLCGAGGGYRMPIIQNIVDLDGSNIELRQKIQECLQLEVRQDDRMPPLICELCVDKVNDFYQFFELSHQTNIRTRKRLGLPLQIAKKGEPEPGDCILGVTEPVYVDNSAKKNKAGPKCSKKIQKEVDTVKAREDNNVPSPTPMTPSESRSASVSSRSSRADKRAPTPPRPMRTYQTKSTRTETPKDIQVAPEKRGEKENMTKARVSKKEISDLMQDAGNLEDNSLLVPRTLKRGREREVELPKPLMLPKRAKMAPKEPLKVPVKEPTPPPPPRPKLKPGPRPKPTPEQQEPKPEPKKIPVPLKILKSKAKIPVTPPKEEVPPPKVYTCDICHVPLKTVAAVTNHTKSHVVTFTKLQNACNPCGLWFARSEEAASHHRAHRSASFPYRCRRCDHRYRSLQLYNEHFEKDQCIPWEEVPDVQCEDCWRTFPTRTLMGAHKCPGVDGRPGGKCSKCPKLYLTHKNLKKHEATCNQRRKRDLIADPDVLRRLKPMQVRVARCDDLLTRTRGPHYDVSNVKPNHGLDKLYHYPYISFKIVKPEPLHTNSMTAIHGLVEDEFEQDSFIHWDSEDSDSDSVVKKVDSLSTLSIKKLFSRNVLGKVPRKRRRVKNEAFDLDNDFGNMSSDINNIISSLGDDSGIDCVVRNMNEQLRISLNHIIGVPDDSMSSIRDLENENVVSNEDFDRHNSNKKDSEIVLNDENVSNKDVDRNDSTEKDSEIVFNNENVSNDDVVRNDSTEKASEIVLNDKNGSNEQVDRNDSTEKKSEIVLNDENVSNEDVDRNDRSEKNSEVVLNDENISNEDVNRNDSTEKDSEIVLNDENVTNEHVDRNDSTEKDSEIVLNDENVSHENVARNDSTEKNSKIVLNNENVSNEDGDTHDSTEKGSEIVFNKENISNEDIDRHDWTEKDSEIVLNDENVSNEDVHRNDSTGKDSEIMLNYGNGSSNENVELNNEHLHNTLVDIGEINVTPSNLSCNDTKLNTHDAQDDRNTIIEKAKVEVTEVTEIENDTSNELETKTENIGENGELSRIENEKVHPQNSEDIIKEVTLHNSVENNRDEAAIIIEEQNITINGNDFDNEIDSKRDDDPELNHDCDNSECKKSEKLNNLVHKECPIKHSIENLIGDTDRSPEKYINEVISSIEDIIMKNPRTDDDQKSNERVNGETKQFIDDNDIDDQKLMDAIDAEIGDTKDSIENDKMTLEDLLPKDHRSMDLDNLSDEDFNFDA